MSNKNPIKEIILNVSLLDSLNFESIDSFCKSDFIKKEFSKCNAKPEINLTYKKEGGTELTHNGFILSTEGEERQILDLTLGRLSYHILDRYIPYDVLLERLDLYWKELEEKHGDEIKVSTISARYINQIPLGKNESMEDFLSINLNSPYKNLEEQFSSFSFYPKENQDVRMIVLVAKGTANNIILDLVAEKHINGANYKNISDLFIGLRSIKNEVFKNITTEKLFKTFDL